VADGPAYRRVPHAPKLRVGLFGPAFDFVFAENRAFAAAFEVAVSPISNLKFEISVAVAVATGFAIRFRRIAYSHS